MGGLIAIRLQGIDSLLAWGLIIAGLLALVPFGRLEAAQAEPLVYVRLLGQPTQWPIQFTAFLFGLSVLGAQIPLSTFARTDRTSVRKGKSVSVRLDLDGCRIIKKNKHHQSYKSKQEKRHI